MTILKKSSNFNFSSETMSRNEMRNFLSRMDKLKLQISRCSNPVVLGDLEARLAEQRLEYDRFVLETTLHRIARAFDLSIERATKTKFGLIAAIDEFFVEVLRLDYMSGVTYHHFQFLDRGDRNHLAAARMIRGYFMGIFQGAQNVTEADLSIRRTMKGRLAAELIQSWWKHDVYWNPRHSVCINRVNREFDDYEEGVSEDW